jgi:hypothetical protein
MNRRHASVRPCLHETADILLALSPFPAPPQAPRRRAERRPFQPNSVQPRQTTRTCVSPNQQHDSCLAPPSALQPGRIHGALADGARVLALQPAVDAGHVEVVTALGEDLGILCAHKREATTSRYLVSPRWPFAREVCSRTFERLRPLPCALPCVYGSRHVGQKSSSSSWLGPSPVPANRRARGPSRTDLVQTSAATSCIPSAKGHSTPARHPPARPRAEPSAAAATAWPSAPAVGVPPPSGTGDMPPDRPPVGVPAPGRERRRGNPSCDGRPDKSCKPRQLRGRATDHVWVTSTPAAGKRCEAAPVYGTAAAGLLDPDGHARSLSAVPAEPRDPD